MADAVALSEREMRPGAHGHLFCFALEFLKWYKTMSRARREEYSDSDGGQDIATKENEGKEAEVSEV